MDKNEMLKEFYIAKITQLIESCQDISLIDFIYRLLVKESKQQ